MFVCVCAIIVGTAKFGGRGHTMASGSGSITSEEDFYSLLNCDESSSEEQISTEFKLLARRHHPDKVADPSEKDAAEKRFLLLKKGRDVLLDADMRQKYDQWRTGFSKWINFEDWMRMQSRLHTSIHWASNTPKMARLEQHREAPDSDTCNTGGGRKHCEGGEGGEGGARDGVGRHGEMVRGEEGAGENGEGGREVSAALQQFRRSGGVGGSRGSKFRNYQL